MNDIKVYEYNEKGEYTREFKSIKHFTSTYNLHYNHFSKGSVGACGVWEFPDKRIAATYRIGKEGIREWRKRKNSPFLGEKKVRQKNQDSRRILVYDLDYDLIATFENEHVARIFLNLRSLRASGGGLLYSKSFSSESGLYLKYENKECDACKYIAIYEGYDISYLECVNCSKTKRC